MLLNRMGQSAIFGDTEFAVGMNVYVKGSDYEGFYGRILEIRDGEHKETENEEPEIECEFFTPKNPYIRRSIEERFALLNREPKTVDDLCLSFVVMAPDMLRPVKRCRIHQIIPGSSPYLFKGYDAVKEAGLTAPPAETYEAVFDGILETDNLDEIFYLLNMDFPEGYTGRSLSISDIVEFNGPQGSEYYYCDTFGYQKIEFHPARKKI